MAPATTGAVPVQKAVNHSVLFASRAPVASPTVVVGGAVREELASSDDDGELSTTLELAEDSGLLEAVSLEAASLDDASLDDAELAGDMLEDIELAGDMLDDIALDDVATALDVDDVDGAAVPLVELHPASRTAAPVSAAIRVVRFIRAPSGFCHGRRQPGNRSWQFGVVRASVPVE